MVQSCKSGRAFRIGPDLGLSLSKYFGPAYKTFFIALGVTIFFFRDVDLLCSPTGSSDKTQLMFSAILLCLFVSKYDNNGSRLNYSSMSSNIKYINMYIICKDKTKRD